MSFHCFTTEEIVSEARNLCAENDAELLYLSLSGSTLYGTRIEGKSDIDARGIFLPKIESIVLGKDQNSIRFASGKERDKNSSSDIDIDLWSLQYWLLKLLPAGDTGAVDLLFSPSNASCTLYRSKLLDAVFAAPLRLIDTANGRTYAEYSIGQAKKYGIKGSHLGALKSVRAFLMEACPTPDSSERLSGYLEPLIARCGDERFCKIRDVNDYPGLFLCGKLHEGSTRMAEFVKRVESDMNRFGERAKEAELNHGLDYKALSHALRALLQMEELLLTGRIVFPLKGRAELIALKEGKLDWRDIENRILSMLDRVGSLQKNAPYVGKPEEEFANACIFNCYGLKTRIATAIVLSDRNNARFESGFEVPDDTLKLIHSKLREAERTKNVKILYCCESGSRGWNFASANSDYDVRFIYIHDMDWYLGVSPEDKSDTIDLGIEKSVCGELDINGWELRKTLKLLRKSNGPLLEKLSSPIVYEEIYSFSKNLRDLAKQLFNPLAAWHHYRGLIERSAERLLTEKPSIKTWFYVLRPLLYMKWIENGHGIPPMRFDNVMNAVVDNEEIKEEIFRLVELKKSWGEYDEFHPSRVICEYIEQLRPQMNPPNPPMAKKVIPDLDGFFRRILELCSPSEKNA